MQLINLTPHPFVLMNSEEEPVLELPPCDNPPRADVEKELVSILEIQEDVGVRVTKVRMGEVKGLPEPYSDKRYVVSRVIAEACPNRTDLYIPDETVRDNEGNIIGCRALAVV